jgi:hypothetical protein
MHPRLASIAIVVVLAVFHRDVRKARERLQKGDGPAEGPR